MILITSLETAKIESYEVASIVHPQSQRVKSTSSLFRQSPLKGCFSSSWPSKELRKSINLRHLSPGASRGSPPPS